MKAAVLSGCPPPGKCARRVLYPALFLTAVGLVMVFSTLAGRLAARGEPADLMDPLWEQSAKLAAGLLALAVGYAANPSFWLERHRLVFGAAVALLALVLVPGLGVVQHGARRWLDLGIGFQPVELARVALVIHLAARLGGSRRSAETDARSLAGVLATVSLPVILLLFQPDFGSALFFVGLTFLVLLLAGVPIAHLAAVAGAGLSVVLLAGLGLDHVRHRIAAFLDPALGYQARQSLLALGAGGLLGSGLGAGITKLGYLPMVSNDFVLAAVGEEAGFVGTSLVLFAFVALLWGGLGTAHRQRNPARYLLASGLALSLALQALLNVAVVTAAVPTKGIALPFVSSGGSSLVACLFAVGLLARLAAETEGRPAALQDGGNDG